MSAIKDAATEYAAWADGKEAAVALEFMRAHIPGGWGDEADDFVVEEVAGPYVISMLTCGVVTPAYTPLEDMDDDMGLEKLTEDMPPLVLITPTMLIQALSSFWSTGVGVGVLLQMRATDPEPA